MKLIGHSRERELLAVAEQRGRLPHAMLFAGPASVGKRIAALELAGRLLANHSRNLPKPDAEALLLRGEHPDLHLLAVEEEKKEISIEQVRNFISDLQLQPYYASNRVAIIDDAHLMSGAASNALLLTLEEPPRDCYLILVTELSNKLLPTILSRTQEVSFGELSTDEIRQILGLLGVERDFEELLQALAGTLAPLELSQFRRPAVAFVTQSAEAGAHIRSFIERHKQLAALVGQAINSRTNAEALSAASHLTGKDISQGQMLRTLLAELRARMVEGASEKTLRNAEALLKAVEASRLITERNLTPALQLSELLVALREQQE